MALYKGNEASVRTSYELTLTDCFAEGDERVKVESATYAQAAISGAAATNDSKGGGLGRTMGTYIDDSFRTTSSGCGNQPNCLSLRKVSRLRKTRSWRWNMDLMGLSSLIMEVEILTRTTSFLFHEMSFERILLTN
jgi:hypothetical protein